MEPWLVASPKAVDNSLKVREPFRIWTREVDGKRLLVLVNTGKKSESIDLNLGAFKPKTVTNFESGTEVALAESRLKAEFAAKQVMIYQLDLEN
jgi:hypothetical protein